MSFPADITYSIMLQASLPELIKLCKTERAAFNICDNPRFWQKKLQLDYPNLQKPNDVDWKRFYIDYTQGRYKLVTLRISKLNVMAATPLNLESIVARLRRNNVAQLLIHQDNSISDIMKQILPYIDPQDFGSIRIIGMIDRSNQQIYDMRFPLDFSQYAETIKPINTVQISLDKYLFDLLDRISVSIV